MYPTNDFSAIAALDLGTVKQKLMHQSGEGWSQEQADAAEFEYRRFLYLMKKYPNEQTSPSVEVDTFWHYHILHTSKYAADCAQAFGYFLHHDPYSDTDAGAEQRVQQRGERMRDLYESTFGTQQAGMAAYCGSSTGTAYCGSPTAPLAAEARSGAAAYCGVALPKTAYCGIPAVKTAYCGIPTAKTAYCGATTG